MKDKRHKSDSVDPQRTARVKTMVKEVFALLREDLAEGGPRAWISGPVEPVDVASRIRFLWKQSRLNVGEIADALGVSESTFNAWIAARSAPSLDYLVRLQEVTGISVQWISTGEQPMFAASQMTAPAVTKSPDGFVLIPRYDVRVSAGNGQTIESEHLKGFLAVTEEWVRSRLHRNPVNLVVIEAFGDSMYPTIADGDIMLVDTSEDRVRGPAIYVILAGAEAIVKRIEVTLEGWLTVKSDNPAYETRTLKADQSIDLRVIGKVVWTGGTI